MPVTAKLSKKLYDTLGEDLAGELVDWFNQLDTSYQANLREFNDLNFQRFDAKLEQRLAQFQATLDRRFAEYNVKLEQRFADYDVKLEQRFAEYDVKLEQRFANYDVKLEQRFADYDVKLEQRFAQQDVKWEKRIGKLEFDLRHEISDLGAGVVSQIAGLRTELIKWMFFFWLGTVATLLGFVGMLG